MALTKSIRVWVVVSLVVLAWARTGLAWHCDGHYLITENALRAVQDSLPAFFKEHFSTVVHCSCDPDIFKQRWTPQARSAEGPEHYMDLEYLKGEKLPAAREGYLNLCARMGVDPSHAGFLPYAVMEWTQRLAVTLAEHRTWPDNTDIHKKCAVYAGLLAHYAADLCQPLHLTIHYDGRVGKAGDTSPHTGIHQKVDALPGKLEPTAGELTAGLPVGAYGNLRAAVVKRMKEAAKSVDRVYELEKDIPKGKAKLERGSPVYALTLECTRASVGFLASLYLTAWEQAQSGKLPGWHTGYNTSGGRKQQGRAK